MKRNKINCPKCDKDISKSNYTRHIAICVGPTMLKIRGIDYDPNIGYKDGSRQVWNKGLNASDARVAQGVKTRIENYAEGKFKLGGWKHTEETKRHFSIYQTKYLQENPDKVPYILNHVSKGMSWPEKQFNDALIEAGIIDFEYEYRNGIYSYDFAFPDIMLDIEIDGGTHLQEKVIAKDKRRDLWSESKGWTVIRFTWKDIKYNLNDCIKIIEAII